MIACMLSASSSVLNCQCVDADCSFAPKAIPSNDPPCHHAAAPAHQAGSSNKECCGKCQLEKAAVLSNELLLAREALPRNAWETIKSFVGVSPKIERPSFFYSEFSESPPGFFERHILNTTFSFRAPPQG